MGVAGNRYASRVWKEIADYKRMIRIEFPGEFDSVCFGVRWYSMRSVFICHRYSSILYICTNVPERAILSIGLPGLWEKFINTGIQGERNFIIRCNRK